MQHKLTLSSVCHFNFPPILTIHFEMRIETYKNNLVKQVSSFVNINLENIYIKRSIKLINEREVELERERLSSSSSSSSSKYIGIITRWKKNEIKWLDKDLHFGFYLYINILKRRARLFQSITEKGSPRDKCKTSNSIPR